MSDIEQTLSIIKPDAVERSLEGEIKNIFTNKGFKKRTFTLSGCYKKNL